MPKLLAIVTLIEAIGQREGYRIIRNNHTMDKLENRQIRIFISSTFQDMQEERDYLITKVFPRIQAEAAKRDVTIVPVDLRWGVTEEESKSGKVIQICLQEIENSHPFFIGLIGKRYGWCPTKEELRKNEKTIARRTFSVYNRVEGRFGFFG